MQEYTVTEYAKIKGLSRRGVQKQIDTGKLKAKKIGSVWIIMVDKDI
jgi:hypothetical protein